MNLRIAFRSIWKRKTFSLINIIGLSIGLSSFTLIGLYIFSEWQVDRHHALGDRIYRVTTSAISTDGDGELAQVGRPLPAAIQEEVPEVERVIPITHGNMPIKYEGTYHYESMIFVGEDYLNTFTFPLAEGNPDKALSAPYQVVISQRLAKKYFGDQTALDQILTLRDTILVKISGVLAPTQPSHIATDMLLSWSTYEALGGKSQEWFTWDRLCYVLLKEHAERKVATEKIAALSMKHYGESYKEYGYDVSHKLEALPEIHLYSGLGGINHPSGSAKKLKMLAIIGLLILLLACVNFINLSTAVQHTRSKEVGIRKTVGASFGQLLTHFLTEATLIVLISGGISICLTTISLPHMERFFDKKLPLEMLQQPIIWAGLIALLLIVILGAGSRPAITLARLSSIKAFGDQIIERLKPWSLRRVLVVFQFCVSTILIVATLVTLKQLQFMQKQSLGFNKENVLVLDLRKISRKTFNAKYNNLKQGFSSIPMISSMATASGLPGRSGWDGQLVTIQNMSQEQTFTCEVIPVDAHYTTTLGLELVSGRDYNPDLKEDEKSGVLLNETACAAFGWSSQEALGKTIHTAGLENGRVIGVLKDFHQHGLQEPIRPIVTMIYPAYRYLALRLNLGNPSQTVNEVKAIWDSQFPGYTMNHFFLDDDFNRQYSAEQKTSNIFLLFAALAVFIGCLGLLGLSAFSVSRKTKEIGIRKVLGASLFSIIQLLSKDLIQLIFIALCLAIPISWYLMQLWLADFAFRIDLNWWIFALAGFMATSIALLTVGSQTMKAATVPPVESLKDE